MIQFQYIDKSGVTCEMRKKLISLLTVFAIITTALLCFNIPTVFGANSGTCGADGADVRYEYDATTKVLRIYGTGAMKDFTIASTHPWRSFKNECVKVIIEEGVTVIGRLAFYDFSSMKSIDIPSTLTKITGSSLGGQSQGGYSSFNGCKLLESITLPEGLVEIGDYAFNGCTSLKSIKFPNSLTTLGRYAFNGCTGLTTVEYGTGMTNTGLYAFYDAGVRNIILSPTITAISNYTFFGCKLTSMEFPETITSIGIRSFANCPFLTSVTVNNPNTVYEGVSIAEEDPFFNGTGSLRNIVFYGHKGSTTEKFVIDHPNNNYTFVSIDKCEHSSTHEVIVENANCTTAGVTTQVCDSCGSEVSRSTINPTGHNWQVTETRDETAVDGHIYTVSECLNGCGVPKNDVGHVSFVDGFYTRTATKCDDRLAVSGKGYEVKTCTVAGCDKVERNVISVEHTVDNYVVTKEANCIEAGSKNGLCSVCNKSVTLEIPALGHQNELVGDEYLLPEDGHYYQQQKCTVCNEESAIVRHGENAWIDGNYTSRALSVPTCTVAGVRLDTCSIAGCSETRRVKIEPTEHDFYETEGTRQEPTCTAKGIIFYACRNCSTTKQEAIEPLGHDNTLKEHVDPTCTTAGYDRYVCNRCGYGTTAPINALNHTVDETNYTIEKEQTCEAQGKAKSVCTVCNQEFPIVLEAYGHSYENATESIKEKPGHTLITPVCTRCNYRNTPTVQHDNWTDNGYTTTVVTQNCQGVAMVTRDTCKYCDKTRNNTYSDVLAHYYSYTGINDKGRLSYTCSSCKNVYTAGVKSTFLSWNVKNINTAPTDTQTGYLYDLNNDGIINAKDYAILFKADQSSTSVLQ